MTKAEFLTLLADGLSGRMQDWEINEHMNFYREAIDDRMEEGLAEGDAVLDMGSAEDIITDILGERSPSKAKAKKHSKKRRLRAFEIVLLIVGSPLWIALIVCAFAIIISLLAVLWSLVVSAWSAFVSFAACSFGGLFAGGLFILEGNHFSGYAMIGAAVLLAGLSIFAFFGCRALTKGSARLTCRTFTGIKKIFSEKEKA